MRDSANAEINLFSNINRRWNNLYFKTRRGESKGVRGWKSATKQERYSMMSKKRNDTHHLPRHPKPWVSELFLQIISIYLRLCIQLLAFNLQSVYKLALTNVSLSWFNAQKQSSESGSDIWRTRHCFGNAMAALFKVARFKKKATIQTISQPY